MFKSIKTGVVAAILISTALISNAQKKINEGTITYGMTYEATPEQQQLISMLPAETKVKFSGDIKKIEIDMGPAKIVALTNGLQESGIVLVDIPMMQKQYAAKTTKEDNDELMGGAAAVLSDFKATGEKQKVGLYNAEKYTYKDDKGGAYELWATNDIQLPAGIIGKDFQGVSGTPVKFTTMRNGIKATITIKDLKEEKTGPLSMDVPPSYELTTMEALKAMRGGQ
jgi:hypothetical protein